MLSLNNHGFIDVLSTVNALLLFKFMHSLWLDSLAMGFYLQHSGLCMVYTLGLVYTSFGYHTCLQPISKKFLAIKDINKLLLHAKFQIDWLGTVENTSDSKSISDSGVWCNEQ